MAFFRVWFDSLISRALGTGDDSGLTRGAILTLWVQSLAALLGLLLHVALVWLIGSETQYGIYLVGVSTIAMVAVPVLGGWDTVLTRYLAVYGQQEDERSPDSSLGRRRAQAVARESAIQVTAGGWVALVFGVGIGVVLTLSERLPTGGSILGYSIVVLSIPALAWSMLRQGAMRGRHRGAISTVPEAIFKPLAVIAGVGLITAAGWPVSGDLALGMHLLASLAAVILGTRLLPTWLGQSLSLRRGRVVSDGSETEGVNPNEDRSAWRQLATSSLTTGVASILLLRVDEWLLGVMVSPAAAGVYGPASRFAALIVFGLNAVNPIFGPLAATCQGDRDALQRLAKRGARLAAVVSTPLGLLLMTFPELPLMLLPPAYAEMACPLRILAGAQWINTLTGSVGTLLAMTGHHRELAWILTLAAIIDVVLCLVLIPWMGPTGAAIATAVAIVFWNLAAWLMVKMRLGIDASVI